MSHTGHESVAEVGLIHMNGRVYDPKLGRFTSADPHIQFEKHLQSHNRYSYALNNPLSYTDPSGFFSFKKDVLQKISPEGAQVISYLLTLVPYVGVQLSIIFNVMYASANGATGGQLALTFVVSALGHYVGGKVAGLKYGTDKFQYSLIQGAVSGGLSGAVYAKVTDGNIGRGILKGAANRP